MLHPKKKMGPSPGFVKVKVIPQRTGGVALRRWFRCSGGLGRKKGIVLGHYMLLHGCTIIIITIIILPCFIILYYHGYTTVICCYTTMFFMFFFPRWYLFSSLFLGYVMISIDKIRYWDRKLQNKGNSVSWVKILPSGYLTLPWKITIFNR